MLLQSLCSVWNRGLCFYYKCVLMFFVLLFCKHWRVNLIVLWCFLMVAIHASILLLIKITKQSNDWMAITSFLINLDRTWANLRQSARVENYWSCSNDRQSLDTVVIIFIAFWLIGLRNCMGNLEMRSIIYNCIFSLLIEIHFPMCYINWMGCWL